MWNVLLSKIVRNVIALKNLYQSIRHVYFTFINLTVGILCKLYASNKTLCNLKNVVFSQSPLVQLYIFLVTSDHHWGKSRHTILVFLKHLTVRCRPKMSNNNKKVLLRERKRHTARRVASARYAALMGGVPRVPPHHPDLARVPPTPGMGYLPPSRPVRGTPPHPRPGMGYPTPSSRPGWGTPPPTQTWDGVPPPPTNVNRQTPVKTVPSRRTTYAGGNDTL